MKQLLTALSLILLCATSIDAQMVGGNGGNYDMSPDRPNSGPRTTRSHLRLSAGLTPLTSISYGYYFTPWMSVGFGAGVAFATGTEDIYDPKKKIWVNDNDRQWVYTDIIGIPIFSEVEFRTAKHKFSLFLNYKLGYIRYFTDNPNDKGDWRENYETVYSSTTIGVSFRYFNLGIGYSLNSPLYGEEIPLTASFGWTIPLSNRKY